MQVPVLAGAEPVRAPEQEMVDTVDREVQTQVAAQFLALRFVGAEAADKGVVRELAASGAEVEL